MSDKKVEYEQDAMDNQQEMENAERRDAYAKLSDIVTESFNSGELKHLNDVMNLIKQALNK